MKFLDKRCVERTNFEYSENYCLQARWYLLDVPVIDITSYGLAILMAVGIGITFLRLLIAFPLHVIIGSVFLTAPFVIAWAAIRAKNTYQITRKDTKGEAA